MRKISSPGGAAAQREEEEEEILQARPLAQRQVGLEGGEVDSEVENTIQQIKGGGQPLPDALRSSMEKGFGADFSGVKVHTGPEADALNDSMSALAFTTGQDIFIREGEYNPGSSSGQELLAHELTHVAQQTGGNHVQRAWYDQQSGEDQAESNKVARFAKSVFKKVEPNPETNKFRLFAEGAGHIVVGGLLIAPDAATIATGTFVVALAAVLLGAGQVLVGMSKFVRAWLKSRNIKKSAGGLWPKATAALTAVEGLIWTASAIVVAATLQGPIVALSAISAFGGFCKTLRAGIKFAEAKEVLARAIHVKPRSP